MKVARNSLALNTTKRHASGRAKKEGLRIIQQFGAKQPKVSVRKMEAASASSDDGGAVKSSSCYSNDASAAGDSSSSRDGGTGPSISIASGVVAGADLSGELGAIDLSDDTSTIASNAVTAIDLSGNLADTNMALVPAAVVAAVVADSSHEVLSDALSDDEDIQDSDDDAPSLGETDDTKSVHSVAIGAGGAAKKKKKKKGKKKKGVKKKAAAAPKSTTDAAGGATPAATSQTGGRHGAKKSARSPLTRRVGGAATKRGVATSRKVNGSGMTSRGEGASGSATVRKKKRPKVPSLAPKETKSPLQLKLELDIAHVDASDAVYRAAVQHAAVPPELPDDANDRSDPKEKERWLEEQAAMTSLLAGMYEPNA